MIQDGRHQHVRAVIFDLDGTLVDSAPDILDCMKKTLDHFELPLASALDSSCIGPPLSEVLQSVSPDITEEMKKNAVIYFRHLYLNSGFPGSKLYPGVLSLLEALQDWKVESFIATNKPRQLTNSLLQTLGIATFFKDWRCLGDNDATAKQELLHELIEKHGLSVHSTTMVGDASSDIDAAHALGIYSIAHLGGYGDRVSLTTSKPDDVVEYMSYLQDALQLRLANS